MSTVALNLAGWPQLESDAAALAAAADAHAACPAHAANVARLAMVVGVALGVRGLALGRLRIAALLHDVGKLELPGELLRRPAGLTRDERALIERHPVDGAATVRALGLPDAARWVRHHHERHDGRGYPDGLVGDASPLGARIIAVADAFETLTAGRPYRPPAVAHAALAELRWHRGAQFDPDVVDGLAVVLERRDPAVAGPVAAQPARDSAQPSRQGPCPAPEGGPRP